MAEVERDSMDDLPEIVRGLLRGRGLTDPADIERFLHPDYDRDLADPFLMSGMEAAVDRIGLAVERGDQVVVYGDYDIDGITATAVMMEGLAAQGITARSYIPDRFEEGYGLNQPALEQLQAAGAQLVISVDCGITSVAEAAWAREHGLDLIITDHHAVPEVIPEVVAVVNPKQPGDQYPFKEHAGVGVAFAVVRALQARTGRPVRGQEKWLLDLVAYGTVCDVVPLIGENRVIVSYGLKVMRQTRRVGLQALAEVAGVQLPELKAHHLGFMLGPRMNAAGRLVHAAASLELVQTSDRLRAAQLAAELDDLNRQRRADQQTIAEAAAVQAEQYAHDPLLVLADPDWSHGVVGIVASKLVEKWGKPVLVAQIMGDHTKGSGRSVPGFNLVEALRAHEGLFERLGGHAFAAGFTLPTARLPELRQALSAYIAEHPPADVAERRRGELIMSSYEPLNWVTLEHFDQLEPFGAGNPEPLWELAGMVARSSRMGQSGQHVRLVLQDGQGGQLSAVAFGRGDDLERLQQPGVRFLGYLNKNEYQGTTSLQFKVQDILYE